MWTKIIIKQIKEFWKFRIYFCTGSGKCMVVWALLEQLLIYNKIIKISFHKTVNIDYDNIHFFHGPQLHILKKYVIDTTCSNLWPNTIVLLVMKGLKYYFLRSLFIYPFCYYVCCIYNCFWIDNIMLLRVYLTTYKGLPWAI